MPKTLHAWRQAQLAGEKPNAAGPAISDDELRESIEGGQLRQQRERNADMTIFSPIAGQMGHHLGDLETSIAWSRVCNDIIARVCDMFPDNFVGVCQLPQSPGASTEACADELKRCVEELGFIGCNLNPDASGGHWTVPPLTDPSYYPIYEAMAALDVPAMIHVSGSCAPGVHHTGAHYINGDTTTFMQLIQNDLFADFPQLRLIIPHGGGAVPYHWGRYRGLALDMGRDELEDGLLKNVYFDTCVYHQPGIDLLTHVIPAKNVLFGSEMIGAVKGIDPRTGFNFDDTKRYVDNAAFLSDADRAQIFEGNARRVFPHLNEKLRARGL
ncbi:4-oxalmesaconate hydratase [Sphingobium boeckii]|uniref:4-oxalmesaconate hydratase n=1 Tax=Sphingobium boeckii TaxID=1082345 RepID=A0A7W9EHG1_9SPHN|nr:4-oxalmesaconate hydratase [Sphingobium boeckii]